VNPRRALALCRRLVDELRRDHRSLALLFVAPVVLTGLLAFILRGQGALDTRAAVIDLDGAAGFAVAQAIGLAAEDSGIVHTDLSLTDEEAGRQAIRDGEVDVVVVIPAAFVEDRLAGNTPALRLITSGVNPGADAGHLGAVRGAIAAAAAALAGPGGAASVPGIEHQTVYGSPEADFVDSFAPVFIGFFAYFFVFILTGVSFLRERVGGTLERLLATPITRAEIVLGYSLGFGLFATIQVAVVLTWSLGWLAVGALGPLPAFTIGLGVPVAGSPLLAYAMTLLLALGAVNLAIFLSTYARTELQIIQFIPIVIVPQGFLSGILFPVDTLPSILQPVARVLPLTYAVEGLREVMIKGADLASRTVQLDLLVLAGIAVFFVVLAAGTIRREVV
jgi:ABC-2 type transport system permease protein